MYSMILTIHSRHYYCLEYYLCLKVGLFLFKACVLAVCMTKAQATTFSRGTAVSTSSAGSKMAMSMVLSRIVLSENSGSKMN